MLVSSKQMILEAQKGGYAVGSFNTSDLEITKAIVRAAGKLNSPVIVETSEKAIAFAGLEQIAEIIKKEAKTVKVPVALNLDHGTSLSIVGQCLRAGYTSVMFDGSKLNFQENKILTRQAAEFAHAVNVPCEGELGSIAKAGENTKDLTDPEMVAEFVKETKIDFLAPSIGSMHGIGGDEKLDLELLKKIRSKTRIPLVLHGASGVSEEDIKEAVKNGISKINIDTDIKHTYVRAIYEIGKKQEDDDPRKLMAKVMAEIQEVVEAKINLFGSVGKA